MAMDVDRVEGKGKGKKGQGDGQKGKGKDPKGKGKKGKGDQQKGTEGNTNGQGKGKDQKGKRVGVCYTCGMARGIWQRRQALLAQVHSSTRQCRPHQQRQRLQDCRE